jgi:hypothetical protein
MSFRELSSAVTSEDEVGDRYHPRRIGGGTAPPFAGIVRRAYASAETLPLLGPANRLRRLLGHRLAPHNRCLWVIAGGLVIDENRRPVEKASLEILQRPLCF